ncbi:MAG: hypothetical protein JXA96_12175 [Sedimentisphaerales bacterium]|nr:hypothetical protein [Sedimentisphaerales bacterium]
MAVTAESCPQCGGSIPHGYGNQVTCQYCGSSLVRLNQTHSQTPGGPPPVPGAEHDAAANIWGVRMKRATYTDVRSGMVAWQWLIPADWEFKGDVWWRDSATMPAIPSFRAWNPNGPEQIEWLPTIPCIWHKTPLSEALSKWTPKSHFFKEDGIESRYPMTSPEVLRSLVVPRYRGPFGDEDAGSSVSRQTESAPKAKFSDFWDMSGGLKDYYSKEKIKQRMELSKELLKKIPGMEFAKKGLKNLISPRYKPYGVPVRIINEELMPKLALSLQGGQEDVFNPLSSDGARIRISYNLDGKQMEEDIFCVVSKVVTQTGMGLLKQENTFWIAEALYAFRASAGNLDAVGQACMASVKSFKINPKWLQFCQMESQRIIKEREMIAKMMQQMAADQRRNLQRLGDLSHSISQASDSLMDGYMARSAAQDRMHDNWTEAYRGVQSYNDPSSDYTPQLPGGYDHAWGNSLGEYIVSNDSSFNPNLYSNNNWQELQRAT